MPDVAADRAVPFPLTMPVTDVVSVIAGVVVAVATLPVNPLAETTDADVTVPVPPVAAMVMLPEAFVMFMFVPAVSVVRVNPVPLPMSSAPFAGVVVRPVPPLATASVTDKPAALPVHEADDPVVFWFSVGNVQLAKLPEAGVPKAGVTSVGDVAKTKAPEPVLVVTTAAARFALVGVARNVATPVPRPVSADVA